MLLLFMRYVIERGSDIDVVVEVLGLWDMCFECCGEDTIVFSCGGEGVRIGMLILMMNRMLRHVNYISQRCFFYYLGQRMGHFGKAVTLQVANLKETQVQRFNDSPISPIGYRVLTLWVTTTPHNTHANIWIVT